ncbi:unnamed protein product [Zymoseptoria tritici ST99CH_1E4]|uniref:1,3-beta-glucanosyltransferase n=1 Tax=Zymoseptoria tritici ST99CH_1E4 TaxID=1276532 RepID=A0A2H1H8I6_ZYMTR|nr:unnamed protein product [Zymoseptoria tritici ST99CH_1E4]
MKAVIGRSAIALATLATTVTAAIIPRQQGSLPPITVEGNAFYAGGERFYIRGVAYQPGGAADAADPMLDMEAFTRDVANFKELGINTIRIYTIDNSANHDEAMKMLDEAGIYLTLDANTPDYSLNRLDIDSLHQSYNDVYLQNVFATIDAFAGYSNLAMFYSGNEVINAKNNSNSAPYVKAVTRDMKNYIKAQAPRSIPVGYSAADVTENIYQQATYFACGDDATARADFFALNDYAWCDPSSFEESGWDQKVQLYGNYSLPLFLSEYGCITNQRNWGEVGSLYSTDMTGVYSGGLAYEYTVEPNGYGLVEVDSSGAISPNRDFTALMQAFQATSNPSGDGGARRQTSVMECPAESENWQVSTNLLPEIPSGAADYIKNGAGKAVGLAGDGSQTAGGQSETEPDLSNGVTTSESDVDGQQNNNNGSSGNGGDKKGAANGREVAVLTMVVGLAVAFAAVL